MLLIDTVKIRLLWATDQNVDETITCTVLKLPLNVLTWLIWHCNNHWFYVNHDLKQFYMNNKSYKGGYGICMTCIEVLKIVSWAIVQA